MQLLVQPVTNSVGLVGSFYPDADAGQSALPITLGFLSSCTPQHFITAILHSLNYTFQLHGVLAVAFAMKGVQIHAGPPFSHINQSSTFHTPPLSCWP
jgi:hypothetical protein